MKILIAGAGIAGLVFGLVMQAKGHQVKIFDKAKELKTIGGGILLFPHGVRYLKASGLWSAIEAECHQVDYMNLIDSSGGLILKESHAEIFSLMDGVVYTINRAVMQQRLVEKLMPDTLMLNKICVAVENKPDHARVIFIDGTEETADLVVGADGVQSAVRTCIFPEREPVYSGFCWWGGMVDAASLPHLPANEMEFILGLGKNGSIWPTQGDRIMWYLPVKMPLAAFAKEEGEAQAIKICEGWHPDVMRVVTAPQTAQRFHVPIYEVDPSPINSKGRTVLIGDAACTFGPLLGQGVNKAIEDAFVLAELISQSTLSVPVLLQQYQAMRSERHERFFELEQLSADALMHDDEESLAVFEEALPSITLAMMYQDVIPLVNQKAFSQLYEKIEKAAKSDAKMSEKARQVAMRD